MEFRQNFTGLQSNFIRLHLSLEGIFRARVGFRRFWATGVFWKNFIGVQLGLKYLYWTTVGFGWNFNRLLSDLSLILSVCTQFLILNLVRRVESETVSSLYHCLAKNFRTR